MLDPAGETLAANRVAEACPRTNGHRHRQLPVPAPFFFQGLTASGSLLGAARGWRQQGLHRGAPATTSYWGTYGHVRGQSDSTAAPATHHWRPDIPPMVPSGSGGTGGAQANHQSASPGWLSTATGLHLDVGQSQWLVPTAAGTFAGIGMCSTAPYWQYQWPTASGGLGPALAAPSWALAMPPSAATAGHCYYYSLPGPGLPQGPQLRMPDLGGPHPLAMPREVQAPPQGLPAAGFTHAWYQEDASASGTHDGWQYPAATAGFASANLNASTRRDFASSHDGARAPTGMPVASAPASSRALGRRRSRYRDQQPSCTPVGVAATGCDLDTTGPAEPTLAPLASALPRVQVPVAFEGGGAVTLVAATAVCGSEPNLMSSCPVIPSMLSMGASHTQADITDSLNLKVVPVRLGPLVRRSSASGSLPPPITLPCGRYACAWSGCASTFSDPYGVRRHMRSHTGEKPYPCTHSGCDKSFGHRQSLDYHNAVTHKKVRPFACKVVGCGFSFPTAASLRAHVYR
jgi:hypothetical protein